MDWSQVLAIAAATIGSTYGFFLIIREDMNKMDARFEKAFEKMDAKMSQSESEWKRLYEKHHEGKRQA